MYKSESARLTWTKYFLVLCSIFNLVTAYRPVQHCKHAGENGHYDACTAITQHYNPTTGESDLFIRYNWYKYSSSSKGWQAIGLGPAMPGSLMFIMYGDPARGELTFSVRTTTGHSPPRPILEIEKFTTPKAKGRIPEVDVRANRFEEYTGSYSHDTNGKPSHLGVAEFIVRGYRKWIGTAVDNTTTSQPMIWASNFKQDFSSDYSVTAAIDMHEFGNGYGFVWTDLLNAETSIPMFGPIDVTGGVQGCSEVKSPSAPTSDELSKGDEIVAAVNSDSGASDLTGGSHKDDDHNPFGDHNTTPIEDDSSTESPADGTTETPVPAPERTIKGKTIRDWMWHLHGLLMTLAFLFIYPLGVYFIRSPRPTAFNYHWTIQSLGTLSLAIGCFIGWLNSYSISITHQYVGIGIACVAAIQLLSGWRHHVRYVEIKRRTWMSHVHMNFGRVMLPAGFINIMTGLRLRGYGWFTQLLVLVVIVLEFGLLAIYLWRSNTRPRNALAATSELKNARGGQQSRTDDAEEYFALGGEDDFSDSDGEVDANHADEDRQQKEQERREQNAKLARLDRV